MGPVGPPTCLPIPVTTTNGSFGCSQRDSISNTLALLIGDREEAQSGCRKASIPLSTSPAAEIRSVTNFLRL